MTQISPSQLVDHLECPRRRWLDKAIRLPKIEKRGQGKADVGTVLHAVCERWLRADDQGRDQTTNLPVELFPPDWDVVKDRGRESRISPSDAQMVRRLVREGIEKGVLRRLPNRVIEYPFKSPVLNGTFIVGKIDQRNHQVIEDHKSTASRKWALSKEKLRKDNKMLCYALEQLRDFPEESKNGVILRLNYFNKDPYDPQQVWEVTTDPIPPAEIEHFRDTILIPAAREMVELEVRGLTEDQWQEVEGPRVKGACEAYGGCAFASVCSKILTPAELREKAARFQPTQLLPKLNDGMSIFERANKRTQAPSPISPSVSSPPSSHQAPAPVSRLETAPVAPATPERAPTAPWATPGCQVPSCNGTGWNAKGLPCRACDLVSGRSGRPTSSMFDITHDQSGKAQWALKASTLTVDLTPPAGTPILVAPEPTPAPGPAVAAEEKPKRKRRTKAEMEAAREADMATAGDPCHMEFVPKDDVENVCVAPVNVIDQTPDNSILNMLDRNKDKVAKALDPDTTMTEIVDLFDVKPITLLCINCVPVNKPCEMLSDILDREGAELAKAKGVTSYYLLNAFERRDLLASEAGTIAKSLAGKFVVSMGDSADLKALRDALRPFASAIIEGAL